MKCPHCGKEFQFKRLPKLNKRQKEIIRFCKDNPRYVWEIQGHLFDNPYIHSCLSTVKGLVKRGLLFPCSPDVHALCSMKEKRARRRKYYTSNYEWAKLNPPKPLN